MLSNASAATSEGAPSPPPHRRAKELFGDCALVEIIHLHDCFRGALKNLEVDVTELCREINTSAAISEEKDTLLLQSSNISTSDERIVDLERRVAGRFTVIWSVFRAHSAAEDEFIWPALKAKQVDLPDGVCDCNCAPGSPPLQPVINDEQNRAEDAQGGRERAQSLSVHTIEQEEYEEDHADEERMFNSINNMLSNLRTELNNRRKSTLAASGKGEPKSKNKNHLYSLQHLAQMLLEGTGNLMRHLMTHLDKEETHCMPLVHQYLTKTEINDLVGKIMGKRSSELMSQILTMAVQNLNDNDRDDMVRYMKEAMVGTFFERWLKMGGWDKTGAPKVEERDDGGGKMPKEEEEGDLKVAASNNVLAKKEDEKDIEMSPLLKDPPVETTIDRPIVPFAAAAAANSTASASTSNHADDDQSPEKYTSAVELEKLIRAIGTNPHLDPKQKNLTIQGLRDSVWKSNCRLSKRKREEYGNLGFGFEQPASQVARMSSTTVSAPNDVASAYVMDGGQPSQSHHMRYV